MNRPGLIRAFLLGAFEITVFAGFCAVVFWGLPIIAIGLGAQP